MIGFLLFPIYAAGYVVGFVFWVFRAGMIAARESIENMPKN